MKVQTTRQILESLNLGVVFKDITYDFNKGKDTNGDKLVAINVVTRNDVKITIDIPQYRVSDVDVYKALLKLSVL